MSITAQEKEVLRKLAFEYMSIATSKEQLETQKLWCALNTGNMQRPMLTIDQFPWNEFEGPNSGLTCEITSDDYWRNFEKGLRRTLFRMRVCPGDKIISPYMALPRIAKEPRFGDFGLGITENTAETDETNDVVSHDYINQFETLEDVEKIKATTFEVDFEEEKRRMQEAEEIFKGIATVEQAGIKFGLQFWDKIAMWMSVSECYYALVDDPELLHAIMEKMTQVATGWVDYAVENKLFDTTSGEAHCSHTITKPFPTKPDEGTAENAWVIGMAQLFSSVAPEVTEEFEIPYMTRLFSKVGNVYYGCCERLDDRLDIVSKLPNLRKVSCSPWSHKEAFAEKLPKNVIMSNKPNPAYLATRGSVDMDLIEKDVKETMAAAKHGGVGLELVLKDLSSVQYEPQRLKEYSEKVKRMLENW